MEAVTLDEFIAEIETTFRNYSDTNDIDRASIKTWVIGELRKFGKNICDKTEKIVEVKDSRVLLPENFKSLILALKLDENQDLGKKPEQEKRLIIERQRIENPAEWTTTTRDYFVNYCESKIVTEKVYAYGETQEKYYSPRFLSLVKGLKSNGSFDVNCLNFHPSIRDNYPDKISITNRTLNTNFREGKIYLQYNALPSQDDEIVIPIFSTGDLVNYVKNRVRIELAQDLILTQKNSAGLKELLPIWLQNDRLLYILAKSEASWNGLEQGFDRRMYNKNRKQQNRYNLPK